MISLCTTLCKSVGLLVENMGLSTGHQTTKLQDVPTTNCLSTRAKPIYAGYEMVNPQSTGLITVISYIYEFPHSITGNSVQTRTHDQVRFKP
jgi:hypothetical protein